MAVPATAVKVAGLAATPDGALYVQSLGVAVGDTITGGTDTLIPYQDGPTLAQDSSLAWNKTTKVISVGGVKVTGGSAANVDVGIFNGSSGLGLATGGSLRLFVTSSGLFQFSGNTIDLSGSADCEFARGGANAIVYGEATAAAGGVKTRTEINKAVTTFTDNVAKAVFTFTVPNAAHSASFLVRVVGSLGAGGAIGANESTQSATYIVDITRTAGVNAVATIGATYGQPAAASVAGAANAATTAALSAISGAVGATNTFTVNVTIARSGGSSDNHTCFAFAQLLNANATGVTVA